MSSSRFARIDLAICTPPCFLEHMGTALPWKTAFLVSSRQVMASGGAKCARLAVANFQRRPASVWASHFILVKKGRLVVGSLRLHESLACSADWLASSPAGVS